MVADVDVDDAAAEGAEHLRGGLAGADGLLDVEDEMHIVPEDAAHLRQEGELAALAAGDVLLRDGDPELPADGGEAGEALAVERRVDGEPTLVPMEDEDPRAELLHDGESALVIRDHVVHAPVVAAEEHHGLDGAGEGVDGRYGDAEAVHERLQGVDARACDIGIGVDEQLRTLDAAEREVVERLLCMLGEQAGGGNTGSHSGASFHSGLLSIIAYFPADVKAAAND